MKKIENVVSKYVLEILELSEPISSEDNLIDLGLDSITVIKLIIKLEDHFNIEFLDEDLQMIYFVSIDEISKLISTKIDYEGQSI